MSITTGHTIGARVIIIPTGDLGIDTYANIPGKLINIRDVSDGDYWYTQVCIRIETPVGVNEVWVNDNEYQLI